MQCLKSCTSGAHTRDTGTPGQAPGASALSFPLGTSPGTCERCLLLHCLQTPQLPREVLTKLSLAVKLEIGKSSGFSTGEFFLSQIKTNENINVTTLLVYLLKQRQGRLCCISAAAATSSHNWSWGSSVQAMLDMNTLLEVKHRPPLCKERAARRDFISPSFTSGQAKGSYYVS